jgi:hypothetical protein
VATPQDALTLLCRATDQAGMAVRAMQQGR